MARISVALSLRDGTVDTSAIKREIRRRINKAGQEATQTFGTELVGMIKANIEKAYTGMPYPGPDGDKVQPPSLAYLATIVAADRGFSPSDPKTMSSPYNESYRIPWDTLNMLRDMKKRTGLVRSGELLNSVTMKGRPSSDRPIAAVGVDAPHAKDLEEGHYSWSPGQYRDGQTFPGGSAVANRRPFFSNAVWHSKIERVPQRRFIQALEDNT